MISQIIDKIDPFMLSIIGVVVVLIVSVILNKLSTYLNSLFEFFSRNIKFLVMISVIVSVAYVFIERQPKGLGAVVEGIVKLGKTWLML